MICHSGDFGILEDMGGEDTAILSVVAVGIEVICEVANGFAVLRDEQDGVADDDGVDERAAAKALRTFDADGEWGERDIAAKFELGGVGHEDEIGGGYERSNLVDGGAGERDVDSVVIGDGCRSTEVIIVADFGRPDGLWFFDGISEYESILVHHADLRIITGEPGADRPVGGELVKGAELLLDAGGSGSGAIDINYFSDADLDDIAEAEPIVAGVEILLFDGDISAQSIEDAVVDFGAAEIGVSVVRAAF